ncbi:unnamed protein product [Ambrosiozyma monospora]|uniref:Unnamed protein product n=1 Tax=Ambrosiozyma monospora TaxID=43982 RepID=A0A9W6T0V1_AMBMO|nr:unnamed protein product [Ambrosiozyma monospora]
MKEIKQADGLDFVPENEMDGFKANLGSQLFQTVPAKQFIQNGLTLLDHTGHSIHFTNANPKSRGGSSEPAIEYFQPYSTDRRKRNKLQERRHHSNINTTMNTRNNNNNSNHQTGNRASAPPIPGLSSARNE